MMAPVAAPIAAPASGSCAAACCAGSNADNANSIPAPKLRIMSVLPSLFRPRPAGERGRLYLLRPPRVAITYEYPRAKMWPAHGAAHRRIPSSGKSRQQAERGFAVDRRPLGIAERIGGKTVGRLDGLAIGEVRAEHQL